MIAEYQLEIILNLPVWYSLYLYYHIEEKEIYLFKFERIKGKISARFVILDE